MLTKDRIHWIDVLKGILILFVVIHHAPFNVNKNFSLLGYEWWNSFIIGFFMPAFFVVTGYCSNFNRPFPNFLWRNVKTILIPCFCLYYFNHWIQDIKHLCFDESSWVTWSHFISPGLRTFFKEGGYYWFLSALFLAKILYYGINRYVHRLHFQVAVSILFLFAGVICTEYNSVYNYFFWKNAIVLVFYLQIGVLLKTHSDKIERYGSLFLITYILIVSVLLLLGKDIPSVTRTIDVSTYTIPTHVLLSLLGTIGLWWLSIKIGKNIVLEYWGRNTIVMYAFNYSILGFLSSALSCIFTPQSIWGYNIFFWLVVILSLLALSFLSSIFNTKYLRFILGKY